MTRYLSWGPRSRAESATALAKRVRGPTLREEGQTLSLIGEVGFVFHPDHHGKGFAAEAGVELLKLGFQGLGMRKEVHPRENEIVKGEWTDELVFAILENEDKPRA